MTAGRGVEAGRLGLDVARVDRWKPAPTRGTERDFHVVARWLLRAAIGAVLSLQVVALLLVLLGNRRVVVRGVSMQPLLMERERVLVDRLAYVGRRPRRGDIVLARGLPGDGPELLLKRIVGLPGETIVLASDRLHVNGTVLDLGRPVIGSSPGTWVLGSDDYFLLSENLAIGTDSRHTGPVRRADLLGRAWLVYAPAVRRVRGESREAGSVD